MRAAYEGFVDGTQPAASKLALLERSNELGEALALAGKDPNAAKSAARVQSVSFVSPTEATVTYDLLSSGTVVLPGAMGKVVKEDGAWKVSAQTFCELTALSAGDRRLLPRADWGARPRRRRTTGSPGCSSWTCGSPRSCWRRGSTVPCTSR